MSKFSFSYLDENLNARNVNFEGDIVFSINKVEEIDAIQLVLEEKYADFEVCKAAGLYKAFEALNNKCTKIIFKVDIHGTYHNVFSMDTLTSIIPSISMDDSNESLLLTLRVS